MHYLSIICYNFVIKYMRDFKLDLVFDIYCTIVSVHIVHCFTFTNMSAKKHRYPVMMIEYCAIVKSRKSCVAISAGVYIVQYSIIHNSCSFATKLLILSTFFPLSNMIYMICDILHYPKHSRIVQSLDEELRWIIKFSTLLSFATINLTIFIKWIFKQCTVYCKGPSPLSLVQCFSWISFWSETDLISWLIEPVRGLMTGNGYNRESSQFP